MNRRFPIIVWLAALCALTACAVASDCPDAACRDDRQLAVAVLASINQGEALKADLLRVEVKDHVVYLHGKVDTMREYLAAEEIARSVPHVTKVVNGLAVDNHR